jgi:hypothetical protein
LNNVPDFTSDNFSNMPNITLSVPFAFAATDGTRYDWNISVVDSFGNTAQSQTNFTATSSPAITSFSPTSAVPGTTVTINGINFDTTPANNTINFGCGQSALATTASATQLQVVVPSNSCTGLLQVNANSKTGSYSTTQLTVLKINTTTGVVSNTNPSTYGQSVTFTANVSPAAATGTVQFFDGFTSLGTAQVVAGSATLQYSNLSSGTHSITASYGGDTSYNVSTSPEVSQTVAARVMIGNNGNFLTLQAAINAAVNSDVLLLRDTRFAENLIVNITLPPPVIITLKGGLADDFSTPAATATSVRKLEIRQGRVNASRLVIKPD